MADERPKSILGIPIEWVDELPGGYHGPMTFRPPCPRCGWPTCEGKCGPPFYIGEDGLIPMSECHGEELKELVESALAALRHSKPQPDAVVSECHCEFITDPDDPDDDWHFDRTCRFCGQSWRGLHCPHDGYQNPCPHCGKRPVVEGGT